MTKSFAFFQQSLIAILRLLFWQVSTKHTRNRPRHKAITWKGPKQQHNFPLIQTHKWLLCRKLIKIIAAPPSFSLSLCGRVWQHQNYHDFHLPSLPCFENGTCCLAWQKPLIQHFSWISFSAKRARLNGSPHLSRRPRPVNKGSRQRNNGHDTQGVKKKGYHSVEIRAGMKRTVMVMLSKPNLSRPWDAAPLFFE